MINVIVRELEPLERFLLRVARRRRAGRGLARAPPALRREPGRRERRGAGGGGGGLEHARRCAARAELRRAAPLSRRGYAGPIARVGNTELEVFPLCLGGNVFGWTIDEERSFEVLDAYVAAGGNFIDTADTYGRRGPDGAGSSERIIGRWMAARGNREELVVATKVGISPDAARALRARSSAAR